MIHAHDSCREELELEKKMREDMEKEKEDMEREKMVLRMKLDELQTQCKKAEEGRHFLPLCPQTRQEGGRS